MRGDVRHRGWWLAVLTTLSLLILALPAAAQADDAWSGASTTSQSWSDTGNWMGGVAPSNPAGTLTFPDLGSCAAPAACYTSHNDLTGISATGLVFSNTTGSGYHILGNGLTVGPGGLTDTSGKSTTLNTPLTLSAPQTWTIGSTGSYNSVSLASPATVGGSVAVSVVFPALGRGNLFADSDMEVGPVTVTGIGGLDIGGPASPGPRTPGSVNGTNGNPVAISSGATLVANPGATVGPLSFSSASLLLGTQPGNTSTTTLGVNGPVSLDSASSTTTFINDNGATPGTDYSQLTASGDVSLGGVLHLDQGTCVALSRGDVATLVSTTGTLTGTYSNAPNGATLTMSSSCQATAPQVQIAYTATSVTATVVSGSTPTTTTLATPSPSPAATNQPVTLSATVSTHTDTTIAPDGTVAFFNDGNPIAGCTSQVLSGSGSSATATCVASFAAGTSPEALTATFTGAPTSGQAGSSSPAQSLTVNQDSTTTSVAASNTSPGIGDSVTYTATVTPGHGGAIKPSGMVQFLDAGQPIAGCGSQALTATSPSSTATCTVSYTSAGSHSITAGYGGDANFGASSSSALTVRVQSAPNPTPPAPRAVLISAMTLPATHIGTTRATLNGSITTGGATATWHFQYGRSTVYNKGTPLQTIAAGQRGPVSVNRALSRLSPNVRYHFRLVVSTHSSSTGPVKTVSLPDRTFTTRATGRLLLPARRLAVIGRTILVPEKCLSDRRCTGRFSITTTVHVGKTKKFATVLCTTKPFGIKAHGHATVKARITSACLALLKTDPHHRIAAKLTSRLRTGQLGLIKKIALALG